MSKTRSLRALDGLAFLAPDVQGGIGPFLVMYMSASMHWNAGRVGTVMFATALIGLLVQAPAGALVDHVRAKPRWIAGALAIIAISVLMIGTFPSYPMILAAQSTIGMVGSVVAPALAAVSLGLVGRSEVDARIGRNAALTAAGTVVWAVSTGVLGNRYGPNAMFAYAVVMAIPAVIAALLIRNDDIDPSLARGADKSEGEDSGRWRDRRLVVLTLCAFLFHLANAALLTLVAQEISVAVGNRATLYVSASLVITQSITMAIAFAVGHFAHRLPRKPIFLIAFLVLPVRALFYLTTADPNLLVLLQVLDGIGAGVFTVMQVLMVSDLTRGSGHFNFGLGIVATAIGAGAAFSNLLGGSVVQYAGYNAGFITLASVSALALLLFLFAMPETRKRSNSQPMRTAPKAT